MILLIIKLNIYEHYETLQPYYIKLTNTPVNLSDIEIKLEECSSIKSLEETLKHEL